MTFELTEDLIIGRGLHRVCYRHPTDDNKCVKVIVQGDGSETEREIAYYQLLQKRQISWAMLPRYYGTIDSNQGKGYVFDLIKGSDNNVAITLEACLASEAFAATHYDALYSALANLYDYLLAENIITMNIKAKNIVYQQNKNALSKLYLVDNIGNSDFLPLASYLPLFGQVKIKRKWQRFIDKALLEYKDNPSAVKLLGMFH